jgi:ABC-type branched-subunit amino acid transport system ATPase component/branched-subunit amino acid ABC-type transport system permease component
LADPGTEVGHHCNLLPFIVTGLVTGAVYGLAAVGLVLTYKTSGIFNFAHGAVATVAAYAFYELHVVHGLGWVPSAAIVVLLGGPAFGLVLELMARRLEGKSLALRVAATVGILVAVAAAVVLHYGQLETRLVPSYLPAGDFELSGTIVSYAQLITFLFAVLSTAGLYLFFRFARLGVAMRAVVDNADLVDLQGTSAVRVRRAAWCVGVMFAAASGVLVAPLLPLDPVQLTLLIVPAFGAAAIGSFTSLPNTFLGGLVLGVLASLSTKYFTEGILAGLPNALPFLVLFAVLLLFPRRWLVDRVPVKPAVRSTWTTPWQLQSAGGAVLLAFLLVVPTFAGVRLIDWTIALATTILFLSLGLLVRTSGQVSLCHITFAAIGAASFSHLSLDAIGLPWPLALLGAGLIAVPVGAVLAVPAIRLSGLYLAIATFGFGIFVAYMFYTSDLMFGSDGEGRGMPLPDVSWLGLGAEKGLYYVVLLLATASAAFVVALNRSRLGRLLRGLADSPRALSTNGVAVNVTRTLVFCISAFLAAIAGALIGMAQEGATVDTFPPLLSLTYLALVIIVLGGEPWYAIMAAFALVLTPSYVSGAETGQWLQLLFGLSAITVALLPDRARRPPARLTAFLDARFREQAAAVAVTPAEPVRVDPGDLQVRDLRVRFGGVVAVDGVSLDAPTGRVTGLIGPNGAGKTTTFNVCSGLQRPTDGRVLLDGRDVTRSSPAARARTGVGRTFQTAELLDSLTVAENVAIGAEGSLAGALPTNHVVAKRSDKRAVAARTAEALTLCGLSDLAAEPAAILSTGQRRLVELARCLAGPYRVLLLDEPTSGLDRSETEQFGAILKQVVAERGVGILVVEHDMSFVMDVCEHVYVLDFGRLIFDGTPAQVQASPLVRAAYLGDDVDALTDGAPPTVTTAKALDPTSGATR